MLKSIQSKDYQEKATDLALRGFEEKFSKVDLSFEEKRLFLFKAWFTETLSDQSELIGYFEPESELNGVINLATKTKHEQNSSLRFWYMIKRFGLNSSLRMLLIFSLLEHSLKEDEVYIDFIVVADSYQRKGVATALLNYAKQQITARERLTLYVSKKNCKAIELYKREGFKVVKQETSLIRKYFFNEADWYFLELKGQ